MILFVDSKTGKGLRKIRLLWEKLQKINSKN